MRRAAALLATLLLPALPARAEQVLTLEVLSAKLAPDRTDVLLRLVDDSGIGVLRPEGQCDSGQPGIGEASSDCYAVTIAENSAPVTRYSYRILDTRGTDSFLLLTWPSAAARERRVSLRVDFNGFTNRDPETVLLLSDADNGALDPDDPFETLHRVYAGKLKAFAAELADNPPVDDAFAAQWRKAFLPAQQNWTQFAESDCVVAARLSGEPARSRCLAERAMDRIDWLEGSYAPN